MTKRAKLESSAVDSWLSEHPGWARNGDALERAYTFEDFATALAFVVRIGMIAEKRDHHPDVTLGWGKASVLWTTHDAGGITRADLELAEASDRVFG